MNEDIDVPENKHLGKKEMIQEICDETGYKKDIVRDVIDSYIRVNKNHLIQKGCMNIPTILSCTTVLRKGRPARIFVGGSGMEFPIPETRDRLVMKQQFNDKLKSMWLKSFDPDNPRLKKN